eukprot:COSAG06_NODE_2295_length_7137_cov_9.154305_5_plen_137_part_00
MAGLMALTRARARAPALLHAHGALGFRRFSAKPTMAMIKELREQTGAPIVDVKKALVESGCDLSEARLWLRNKGLAKAQKKAGRVTAEGLVAVASDADGSSPATKVRRRCQPSSLALFSLRRRPAGRAGAAARPRD